MPTVREVQKAFLAVTASVLWLGAQGFAWGQVPPRETAPKALHQEEEVSEGVRAPTDVPVYTWKDGDRTLQVFLQPNLEVRADRIVAADETQVARAGNGFIVRTEQATRTGGQPVFRSQSGTLMTLPGGILVAVDPAWSKSRTDTFFAANGIAADRVEALEWLAGGFFVKTEPGFPSLNLANALAEQSGVRISSPNWWREMTTR